MHSCVQLLALLLLVLLFVLAVVLLMLLLLALIVLFVLAVVLLMLLLLALIVHSLISSKNAQVKPDNYFTSFRLAVVKFLVWLTLMQFLIFVRLLIFF